MVTPREFHAHGASYIGGLVIQPLIHAISNGLVGQWSRAVPRVRSMILGASDPVVPRVTSSGSSLQPSKPLTSNGLMVQWFRGKARADLNPCATSMAEVHHRSEREGSSTGVGS